MCLWRDGGARHLIWYKVYFIAGERSSNTSKMDWLTRMILISCDLRFSKRSCRIKSVEVFEPKLEEGLKLSNWSNDSDQFGRIEVDDELSLKSRWWNSNVGGDNRKIVELLNWKNQEQWLRFKPQINGPEWCGFGSHRLNKRMSKILLPYTSWQVSQRILVWDSSPELTTW